MPSHAVSLNRRHLLAAAVLSSLGNASWSQASHWPVKAVKFTVPFPPGGPVDTTARIFTQKLATMWNQAAIIDNRAGAGGVVGAAAAAKDPADGYNFFVGSIHHAVNPWLMGKLSYDIEKDFVPVSFAALFPVFLVAHPSVPANNVKELIALSQKGTVLSYGSSGNGGGTHLAGELFNMEAGTQLQHIPYKGSAPAMTDLLGGQIQLMFADAPRPCNTSRQAVSRCWAWPARSARTCCPRCRRLQNPAVCRTMKPIHGQRCLHQPRRRRQCWPS
jgi:tripartite-type tricarboxylate transporter receptor subunit TctC